MLSFLQKFFTFHLIRFKFLDLANQTYLSNVIEMSLILVFSSKINLQEKFKLIKGLKFTLKNEPAISEIQLHFEKPLTQTFSYLNGQGKHKALQLPLINN